MKPKPQTKRPVPAILPLRLVRAGSKMVAVGVGILLIYYLSTYSPRTTPPAWVQAVVFGVWVAALTAGIVWGIVSILSIYKSNRK